MGEGGSFALGPPRPPPLGQGGFLRFGITEAPTAWAWGLLSFGTTKASTAWARESPSHWDCLGPHRIGKGASLALGPPRPPPHGRESHLRIGIA